MKNSHTDSNKMKSYKEIVTMAKKSPTSDNFKKDNKEDTYETYLKMIEKEEFKKSANRQMNEIVNRFIKYKVEELKLENYTDEEIENIIDEMLNLEYDEYDYYYSSDEDDVSLYSDEEYF